MLIMTTLAGMGVLIFDYEYDNATSPGEEDAHVGMQARRVLLE